SHSPEGADGRVDAARHHFESSGEQRLRLVTHEKNPWQTEAGLFCRGQRAAKYIAKRAKDAVQGGAGKSPGEPRRDSGIGLRARNQILERVHHRLTFRGQLKQASRYRFAQNPPMIEAMSNARPKSQVLREILRNSLRIRGRRILDECLGEKFP